MASPSKSAKTHKTSFTWTEESRMALLEICADYQSKRANSSHTFKWAEIARLFIQRSGIEVTKDILRNKLDSQKKEYKLWKKLRTCEAGLGYDASTGQILAMPLWWEHKIKENPHYKKFRIQGVRPHVEELWARLFDGVVATEENCSVPGMAQSTNDIHDHTIRPTQSVSHEQVMYDTAPNTNTPADEDLEADMEVSQTIASLRARVTEEQGTPPPPPQCSPVGMQDEFSPHVGSSVLGLVGCSSAQAPKTAKSMTQRDIVTGHICNNEEATTQAPKRIKSITQKDSITGHICSIGEASKKYSTSPNSPEPRYTETDTLQVLYRMADKGLLERHGQLFVWACIWLLDKGRRNLFMNFEDDDGRFRLIEEAHKTRCGV